MASMLRTLSDELAAAADQVAPSVVQVHGPRRAAAGVVFDTDLVLTSSRGLDAGAASVRGADGVVHECTVLGRGRTTSLAVVRVHGLGAPAATVTAQPRPGHLAQAVGRTWSGGLCVAFAPVAVVGGPLRTGRATEIPRVIRIGVAPHGALTGGALVDGDGHVLGIVTGTAIRGTTVVVPSEFAWADAREVVATGGTKQGYLGIGSMPVLLAEGQRQRGRARGLLVTAVAAGGPAAAAGGGVGDLLVGGEGAPEAAHAPLRA
ncbi:MAG: serine protease, partial [Acidobacteria bacterium]|nr:serine protease [Acidobacteriota bacterium]